MSDVFPVPSTTGPVRSTWGAPRGGGTRTHEGIDIFAQEGARILAPFKGYIVSNQDEESEDGGWWATLQEKDNGRRVYLAHFNGPALFDRTTVNAGEHIANVGRSGNARTTAPHLHLELRPAGPNSAKVDPAPWLLAILRGEEVEVANVEREQDLYVRQARLLDQLIDGLQGMSVSVRPYSSSFAELLEAARDDAIETRSTGMELAAQGGYREAVNLYAAQGRISTETVRGIVAQLAQRPWYSALLTEEQWQNAAAAIEGAAAAVAVGFSGALGLLLVGGALLLLLSRK